MYISYRKYAPSDISGCDPGVTVMSQGAYFKYKIHTSVFAAWGLVLHGVWCCMGFGAAWGLVLHGVWCCMGFGAAWGLVLHGVWCCMGFGAAWGLG